MVELNHVLIIADIEGSSGCWEKKAAKFLNRRWYEACVEMTKDVNAVSQALFYAGISRITVKDFHRTGYNIIPENIDSRIELISGYRKGAVPGFAQVPAVSSVLFIGMHAASGTKGFLAHTLTSKISRLVINGKIWSEVELFSASIGPHGIRPVFFSGCPEACRQAKDAIAGIKVFPIVKSVGRQEFDPEQWRKCIGQHAVKAVRNSHAKPFLSEGPFNAIVCFHDGKIADRISRRWGFVRKGRQIKIEADTFPELYMDLIRISYLTPLIEKMLPFGLLALYNLIGFSGLNFYHRKFRRDRKPG
jgi:D-amino peptidase